MTVIIVFIKCNDCHGLKNKTGVVGSIFNVILSEKLC